MRYDFAHPPERNASECIKWQTFAPDVIPLWIADMDFRSPEPVISALLERVRHGVFGYPRGLHAGPDDLLELRSVVLERLEARYDWRVEPQALVFLPGVAPALHLASLAFAAQAGGVLVQTPVYEPILKTASNTGAIAQSCQLMRRPDGSYEINWDAFEKAITPQTRLFILCNPHNPVGRVYTLAELERMAEICLRRGVLLCSDEIHSDLIYPGQRHIPLASIAPEIAARTITFIAPSKTFNLAGLQCAVAVILDSELRNTFLAARKGLVPWVNLLGLVAALAAYREGHEWLDQLLVYLQANRDLLVSFVQQNLPGVVLGIPQATYLAWLDFNKVDIEGNPGKFFLDRARVALNEGESFGPGGEGFVRLNFGCSRALLSEALDRMKLALK